MSQTIVAIDPAAVLGVAWTTSGQVEPRNARVCDMRHVRAPERRMVVLWDFLRKHVPERPDVIVWEDHSTFVGAKIDARSGKAKPTTSGRNMVSHGEYRGLVGFWAAYGWDHDQGLWVDVLPNTWKKAITGKAFDRTGLAEIHPNATQSQRTEYEKGRVMQALQRRWPQYAERIGDFDHNAIDALAMLAWYVGTRG